jgi:hypothetical protein
MSYFFQRAIVQKWSEENHPRVPAGESGGGQFTSDGGAHGEIASHRDMVSRFRNAKPYEPGDFDDLDKPSKDTGPDDRIMVNSEHNEFMTTAWSPERLSNTLTSAALHYDQLQSTKAGYNMYALPQYLEALDKTLEEAKSGTHLRDAIKNNFTQSRLADALLRSVSLTWDGEDA